MKHLPISIMLDRFLSAFENKTGQTIKRSVALEIIAASLGYHNSNELTAAAKNEKITIPHAQRTPNTSMVALKDPYTGEVFGIAFNRLEMADKSREKSVLISTSGNLLRIDGLKQNGEDEEACTKLPSAAFLADELPHTDKEHVVKAIITDDNDANEISLNASAFLAEQSDDTLQTMANNDWSCSSETDRLADWSPIQESDDMKSLWNYINIVNKTTLKDGIGYNVEINREDAENWIRYHRPELFILLQEENEEETEFTTSSGRKIHAESSETIIRNALNILKNEEKNKEDIKAVETLINRAKKPEKEWMPTGLESGQPQSHVLTAISKKILETAGNPEKVSSVESAEKFDTLSDLADQLDALSRANWPHLKQYSEPKKTTI